MRQVMVRGLKKVDQMFVLNMAAYNLVRMRSLGQVRRSGSKRSNEAKNRPQTIGKAAEFAVKLHHPKNNGVSRADRGMPSFARMYFSSSSRLPSLGDCLFSMSEPVSRAGRAA
jgi:hypothetical protein